MIIRSWGNYPLIKSNVLFFDSKEGVKKLIKHYNDLIPYGNGRSYGDSPLNKNIIKPNNYNSIINFNQKDGIIHIQSGILLSEIIKISVPSGWFLETSPGTKFITIGGAIASDIHGKNHHKYGCFSECVLMFNLMLPDGKIVKCSKNENVELFRATCGGMGLTGLILDVKISLKKINSRFINQTTIKTKNIEETFEAFEKYKNKSFSVAWIDCLAKGDNIGRSLLTVGDFADDGNLNYKEKFKWNIPFNFPSFVLNQYTMKLFNWIYYNKTLKKQSNQKIDLDSFFYPLDSINNWNRIYGKNGFTQYQFIFPKELSFQGLREILTKISDSGKGSFLAVLKLYGKENLNYLSFPIEGYSLALDFKLEKDLFSLLDELDKIILKYNGRIYLAKDVRVNKEVFEKGYPKIDKFRLLRKKYSMDKKFNSLQSKRVGI